MPGNCARARVQSLTAGPNLDTNILLSCLSCYGSVVFCTVLHQDELHLCVSYTFLWTNAIRFTHPEREKASLACANWEIGFDVVVFFLILSIGAVSLFVCVCVLTMVLATGHACSTLLIPVYNRWGSHIT